MGFLATAIAAMAGALLIAAAIAWRIMVWMPGRGLPSAPLELKAGEQRVLAALQSDLNELAVTIGERHLSHRYAQLVSAAEFIERSLRDAGYQVRRQEFDVAGKTVWNVEVERVGRLHADQIVVSGAHYDTVPGSPGANDNGSAVVANLALAREFAAASPDRTLRFVFFVNEESPYYMTDAMGSLRYAQACRSRSENVVAMLSLETIGCYLRESESQRYPISLLGRLYPTTGDFVAFVGDVRSRRLVHQVVRGFRRVDFPSQGMAAPRRLKDIFRSDHAAFWQCGYPALMITDTANFRYPHYHTPDDTVDKVDFPSLARVVSGLKESLLELVDAVG